MKVLGVLAGEDMPLDLLGRWAKSADLVYAADGGADLLSALSITPDVVLGDLDGSAKGSQDRAREVVHLPSQDYTDVHKLLTLAAEREHAEITLASVEGDLLDHVLATLHTAAQAPLEVRIGLRRGIGWILQGGNRVEAPASPGARVSLIPLSDCRGVDLTGVHWSLEQAELGPLGRTSISNLAVETIVSAQVEIGAAMLFVAYPDAEMPFW